MGLNLKKLESSIKNYLEKASKLSENLEENYSEDFQKTLETALKVAVDRNHKNIGEKEILVGLAKEDEFLKQILVDFDLKPEDIKYIVIRIPRDLIDSKYLTAEEEKLKTPFIFRGFDLFDETKK